MQRIQFKFMLDPTGPVLVQEWLEVITLRRRGALERPLSSAADGECLSCA